MSHILVFFGTTEGQTAKIAEALGARFHSFGHHADVVNARTHPETQPDAYDAVIVAAPVRAGRYQRDIVTWVSRHLKALNSRPTAFVSVCLGTLQHEPAVDRELLGIINQFLESTAWRPSDTHVVAGALMYTRYNFITRWLMRRIAKKAGGATDTSRDYEYTNWADLDRFADTFRDRIGSSATSASA